MNIELIYNILLEVSDFDNETLKINILSESKKQLRIRPWSISIDYFDDDGEDESFNIDEFAENYIDDYIEDDGEFSFSNIMYNELGEDLGTYSVDVIIDNILNEDKWKRLFLIAMVIEFIKHYNIIPNKIDIVT